ncbi:hypothetical protein F2P81_001279 [Scophthalmus maximus]|uniref:Uncharacterized protein n=1 Tax=Scophthalmus maximus TaxID=52904 RepID=A0A6A4TJC4_SCOMX|nr:hypothetical protein F2P81_001279 [Scophthalmus maximus]
MTHKDKLEQKTGEDEENKDSNMSSEFRLNSYYSISFQWDPDLCRASAPKPTLASSDTKDCDRLDEDWLGDGNAPDGLLRVKRPDRMGAGITGDERKQCDATPHSTHIDASL